MYPNQPPTTTLDVGFHQPDDPPYYTVNMKKTFLLDDDGLLVREVCDTLRVTSSLPGELANDEDLTCIYCQEKFEVWDTRAMIMPCGHFAGIACLRRDISTRIKLRDRKRNQDPFRCPICRTDFSTEKTWELAKEVETESDGEEEFPAGSMVFDGAGNLIHGQPPTLPPGFVPNLRMSLENAPSGLFGFSVGPLPLQGPYDMPVGSGAFMQNGALHVPVRGRSKDSDPGSRSPSPPAHLRYSRPHLVHQETEVQQRLMNITYNRLLELGWIDQGNLAWVDEIVETVASGATREEVALTVARDPRSPTDPAVLDFVDFLHTNLDILRSTDDRSPGNYRQSRSPSPLPRRDEQLHQRLEDLAHGWIVAESWAHVDDRWLAEQVLSMMTDGLTEEQVASEVTQELASMPIVQSDGSSSTLEFSMWLFAQRRILDVQGNEDGAHGTGRSRQLGLFDALANRPRSAIVSRPPSPRQSDTICYPWCRDLLMHEDLHLVLEELVQARINDIGWFVFDDGWLAQYVVEKLNNGMTRYRLSVDLANNLNMSLEDPVLLGFMTWLFTQSLAEVRGQDSTLGRINQSPPRDAWRQQSIFSFPQTRHSSRSRCSGRFDSSGRRSRSPSHSQIRSPRHFRQRSPYLRSPTPSTSHSSAIRRFLALAEDTPRSREELQETMLSMIQGKVVELSWTGMDDTALAEYIVMMITHGKSQNEFSRELAEDLLGMDAHDEYVAEFVSWLFEQYEDLQERMAVFIDPDRPTTDSHILHYEEDESDDESMDEADTSIPHMMTLDRSIAMNGTGTSATVAPYSTRAVALAYLAEPARTILEPVITASVLRYVGTYTLSDLDPQHLRDIRDVLLTQPTAQCDDMLLAGALGNQPQNDDRERSSSWMQFMAELMGSAAPEGPILPVMEVNAAINRGAGEHSEPDEGGPCRPM